MVTMACDDVSGGQEFCQDLEEIARLIRRRAQTDVKEPAPVAEYRYRKNELTGRIELTEVKIGDGPWTAIPRSTVQPNQNAINEELARLENSITDLYAERMQRMKQGQSLRGSELASVDSLTKAAASPDVYDAFAERMLKRRQR